MIDLDATQPIALTPTLPDLPLTWPRRTYRARRPSLGAVLLGLSPAVLVPLFLLVLILPVDALLTIIPMVLASLACGAGMACLWLAVRR